MVLDDRANAAAYSAYLNVLGRLGDATGYPAIGVTVTRAQQASAQAGKDLLVIAGDTANPLLKTWLRTFRAATSRARTSACRT
ncbi:cellulose biosynthesis cyclic di-GMP-binding regulatory protein BcsB [Achromobacter insuavis]